MFKESFILIFSHISFISIPNCLQTIDLLSIQLNRVSNEQGMLLQNLFNFTLSWKFTAFWLQLECNLCTSLNPNILNWWDLISTWTVWNPSNTHTLSVWLWKYLYLVSYYESWIETNSKLTYDWI
jgi:hypothetical protein